MTAPADAPDPLAFPPPAGPAAADWASAEREALKFPARYLKKAREAKDARDDLRGAWDEANRLHERLNGFVVRNLIAIADNCRPALPPPAPPAADSPPPDDAGPSPT